MRLAIASFLIAVCGLAAGAGVAQPQGAMLAVANLPGDRVRALPPADGPLDNPLKGWCTYVGGGPIHQPYSMFYQNVSLKELAPAPGIFDFAGWEQRTWNGPQAAGRQIVFRVYLDYPSKPSGIPDWLIAGGLKTTRYSEFGGGESPDYGNPLLLATLDSLIAALGQRYDHNPRVAFIELGLLGHWGEWHTYPRPELFASDEVQQRIIDDYRRAFPDKILMARTAGGYAGKQDWLGFHDDLFPVDTDGPDGWQFLPVMRQAGRKDNWRCAAIGGELEPGNADHWFEARPDATRAAIENGHFSWLGPYNPGLDNNQSPSFLANCQALVRRMGYQFALKSVAFPRSLVSGGAFHAAVSGENQGVAPFYYPWPVVVALVAPDGDVAQSFPASADIRTWLPGPFELRVAGRVDAAPGNYHLALGIISPYKKAPDIRFANALPCVSGWTYLADVVVAGRTSQVYSHKTRRSTN